MIAFRFWYIALIILASSRFLCAAEDVSSAPPSAFNRFFTSGGPLVWFALLPLSIFTISLIIQFFILLQRNRILPPAYRKSNGASSTDHYKTDIHSLAQDPSFLGKILLAGARQTKNGIEAMESAVAESLEQQTMTLLRKIEWLHTIGNVAPMIGLFGTVWGMIDAFNSIVTTGGQPEPADLAGGISIALVTTRGGLLIAIPALGALGILRNRLETYAAEAALLAEDFLRNLLNQGINS